ncbi:MAG: hypothetical protein QOK35_490, partial [Pseudonocardiales bacterium]|nr:hypothetical protein [Pseudonocardiales bacterium]
MAFTVQMPALGESVTEGTVTRWLKQEGDRVVVDEPLLEVSTDKVDTEIPSPAAGVLERIVAGEDETVEVGGDLAVIGDGDGGGSGGGGEDSAQDEADDAGDDDADDDAGDDEEPDAAQDEEQAPAEEEPGGSDGDAPQYPNKAAEPAAEADSDTSSDSGETTPSGGGSGGSGGGRSVTMPELGESVTEGTVTRWLKQVGDTVEVDEPLLEVSTDKVDTEIPSPVAGTLLSITVDEDETVQVGAELAVVGDPDQGGGSGDSEDRSGSDQTTTGESDQDTDSGSSDSGSSDSGDSDSGDSAPTKDAPAAERDAEAPKGQEPAAERPAPKSSGGAETAEAGERAERQEVTDSQPDRPSSGSDGDGGENDNGRGAPYVTPLVRKLAAEHQVDLGAVSGSGVGGRIRKQDVLSAAERQETEKKAAQEKEAAPAATESRPAADRPSRPQPTPAKGAPEPGSTVKMPRLRQVIAQRMTESLRVSAQLTTVQEVDVTRIARLRA